MTKTEITYNSQNLPTSIVSSDKKLELKILTWAEPNNGRMLWQVNVILNNENFDLKVFDNGWNYINNSIAQLDLADSSGRYYYVPVESFPRLIDTETNEIIKLPYINVSTVEFKGNVFYKNFLFEVCSGRLQCYDLETKTSLHYSNVLNDRFLEIIDVDDSALRVHCERFDDAKWVKFEMEIKMREFVEGS